MSPNKPIDMDPALWEDVKGNITAPEISCLYTVDSKHAISSVLPPGYSCTLTNIPYCNPIYGVDFTFRFFINAKEVVNLPIECKEDR